MKKKLIFIGIILSLISLGFVADSPYARRIRPVTGFPVSCIENEIAYDMVTHVPKFCDNTGTYQTWAGGGSAAPIDGTFITQIPNATLTNEQALSALATGLVKNTTTTGVLSIALAGTDYESPLTFTASDFDPAVNTISLDYTNGQAASGSLKGFLASADWTTFNNKESVLTFSSPLVRTTNNIACATCGVTGSSLAQFASTTSAELLTLISNETGTGSLVFSASPTFTGSPIFADGTSAAPGILFTSNLVGIYKSGGNALGMSFASGGGTTLTFDGGGSTFEINGSKGMRFFGGVMTMRNTLFIGNGTNDATVNISRNADGILQVGTTSANSSGQLMANSIVGGGSTPSVGTCGTIGTGSKNSAGFITSTTTGACVSVLTFSGYTATTGWSCGISNGTTANLITQTGSSTTTATFTGTTVTGDILRYVCMAY